MFVSFLICIVFDCFWWQATENSAQIGEAEKGISLYCFANWTNLGLASATACRGASDRCHSVSSICELLLLVLAPSSDRLSPQGCRMAVRNLISQKPLQKCH